VAVADGWTHAKETGMEKHELDHQELVAYETPVLAPARAKYGSQGRIGPMSSANIICSECSAGT
jgi:hypothetical protein